MLTYARSTTLAAVEGLKLSELDHVHDEAEDPVDGGEDAGELPRSGRTGQRDDLGALSKP